MAVRRVARAPDQEKKPRDLRESSTSPVCPPLYAPGKTCVIKCLRAPVDNPDAPSGNSFVFRERARIFRPRRRTRKWPAELENGSQNGVRLPKKRRPCEAIESGQGGSRPPATGE